MQSKNCLGKKAAGFTLLEILIALFIFSILSIILAGALRSVINAQSGTEKNALRLRELQFALLIISHDVEQAVNRPVMNAADKEEAAFIGSPQQFTFTHTGVANEMSAFVRSTSERVSYSVKNNELRRDSFAVLDQAANSKSHERILLQQIGKAHMQYLNKEGRFLDYWPDKQSDDVLPKAVRFTLTLYKWGELTQLYVIPAQNITQGAPAKS